MNSFYYLSFVAVVYPIFHLTPQRWRWLLLLAASYVFYGFLKAPYLLAVLVMVTGISYACGLRIAAQQDEIIRRRWLRIGSFSCGFILVLLKCLPFLDLHGRSIPGLQSTFFPYVISIGVSYFTFQAISYLADIYFEVEEPEHHFGRYALYLAFFPKLLQGPIERAGQLIPQLKAGYQFCYDNMRRCLVLFALGLFKKVVVADRIALYADTVYSDVHSYTGLALLLGTYAYALQIYFDFSGYTDMARATGRMFGINLTENFNTPYLATSIADFWRRWHISFSRWILDYLFKPLQFGWRDWGQAGTAAALIVTFLISGLWHGVSWGFLCWGGLHGSYLALALYWRPYQRRLHKWLGIEGSAFLKCWQVFATFHMVSLAWVFFRANSLADARYVIGNALNLSGCYHRLAALGLREFVARDVMLLMPRHRFVADLMILGALYLLYRGRNIDFYARPAWFRWSAYYALLVAIMFLGAFNSSSKFIYIQF